VGGGEERTRTSGLFIERNSGYSVLETPEEHLLSMHGLETFFSLLKKERGLVGPEAALQKEFFNLKRRLLSKPI